MASDFSLIGWFLFWSHFYFINIGHILLYKYWLLVIVTGLPMGDLSIKEESPFSPSRVK